MVRSLTNFAPRRGYRGLKDYGDQHKRDWPECNQALETALLQRDDPLIDLGLAQFANTTGVVSAVFKKGSGRTNTYARYTLFGRVAD